MFIGEAHVMASFSNKDLILLDQMEESGEVCWPIKQFLGLPQSLLLWCEMRANLRLINEMEMIFPSHHYDISPAGKIKDPKVAPSL